MHADIRRRSIHRPCFPGTQPRRGVMLGRTRARQICAVICCAFAAIATKAQSPALTLPDHCVFGTGTVTIERPAQLLRMRVALTARHQDLAEAINTLKTSKEAALQKVKSLGALDDSIHFSSAQVSAAGGDSAAQMERMVMMRMQSDNFDEEAFANLPKTVTVTLSADWALEGEDGEALIVQANQLQQRITEADVAGSVDAPSLSPEEQELMEEMEGMSVNYGMPPQQKPGEPEFRYVVSISEADRDKAFADAFQKASRQAQQLARAAGATCGPLRSLSGSGAAAEGTRDDPYTAYMRQMMMSMGMGDDTSNQKEDEVLGSQPGRVAYRIVVNAAFTIEPGQ